MVAGQCNLKLPPSKSSDLEVEVILSASSEAKRWYVNMTRKLIIIIDVMTMILFALFWKELFISDLKSPEKKKHYKDKIYNSISSCKTQTGKDVQGTT